MAKISQIWAREILDSRGIPTVETVCSLNTGEVVSSSVPSGTSTGSHEALELRDKDSPRYKGMGVLGAVENVNKTLAPAIVGMDPTNQKAVDEKLISLDGTENKSKYGANAILSVSEAVFKAGALASSKPLYLWANELAKSSGIQAQVKLPTPFFNMVNGGLHGAGNLDFQEFHVIPSSTKSFSQGLKESVEIFMTIGQNLERKGAIHSVGNEGGYAPNLFTNTDALEIIIESIKEANYSIGRDVLLGLDIAANSFYKNGEYTIRDKSAPLDESAMIEFYKNLNTQYDLAFLEDPFFEDAWESWKSLTSHLADRLTIVGDDLLATNRKRVERAVKEKTCSGILVKPNQVGTVWETLGVIKIARSAGWKVIVSHRSGETNDTFIADFAVGAGADYVKFGAPNRGERVAKYNRLSAIELELSQK